MNRTRSGGMLESRAVVVAVLLLVAASTAQAQRATGRTYFGPHVGLNFDSDDALIGAQFTFPVTNSIEFYPSLDIYFPNEGSLLGLSMDLKFGLATVQGPHFYVGGGLNVLHSSFRGEGHSDAGLDLIFGLESRSGPIHPFGEGRVLIHDNTSFQLVGGLNFALGGR